MCALLRLPGAVSCPAEAGAAWAAGTVFKRFDASKLFALTCQDVVERFHLLLVRSALVRGTDLWQSCSHTTLACPACSLPYARLVTRP